MNQDFERGFLKTANIETKLLEGLAASGRSARGEIKNLSGNAFAKNRGFTPNISSTPVVKKPIESLSGDSFTKKIQSLTKQPDISSNSQLVTPRGVYTKPSGTKQHWKVTQSKISPAMPNVSPGVRTLS